MSLASLAACGGGGSVNDKKFIGYSGLLEKADGYIEKYKTGTVTTTPSAMMPTVGTAVYRGVGAVSVAGDGTGLENNTLDSRFGGTRHAPINTRAKPDLLGKARLVADFSNNTVKGTITHFQTLDGSGNTTKGGKIHIDGKIDLEQIGYETGVPENDVNGKLRGDFDLNGKNYPVNLVADGEFTGDKAKGIFIGGDNKALNNQGKTETPATLVVEIFARDSK